MRSGGTKYLWNDTAKKRDDFWYSVRVSPKNMTHPLKCDHPHGFTATVGGSMGPLARGCGKCGWLAGWGIPGV